MDISYAGQKSNYIYGYLPKEEPLPEGWVRTLRPCTECNSEYTYIDADKVWHCARCGWRSDEKMKYSDEEVQCIIEKKNAGVSSAEIALILGRDPNSLAQKVFQLRKKGLLGGNTESKEPEVAFDAKPHDEPCVSGKVIADIRNEFGQSQAHKPVSDDTPDPLCNALLAAKGIGLSLLSACVDSNTATLVFTLDLAKRGVE